MLAQSEGNYAEAENPPNRGRNRYGLDLWLWRIQYSPDLRSGRYRRADPEETPPVCRVCWLLCDSEGKVMEYRPRAFDSSGESRLLGRFVVRLMPISARKPRSVRDIDGSSIRLRAIVSG